MYPQLVSLLFPRATMSERKAVIKNADMSEDMQQDAVECATQALEKYNIEKDIAAFIKKVGGHTHARELRWATGNGTEQGHRMFLSLTGV